jgi:hypothetical protein
VDAYKGVDVTPLKLKKVLTKEFSTVIAWVSYTNDFFRMGYWRVSNFLQKVIDSHIGQKLPVVGRHSPILGWEGWCSKHVDDCSNHLKRYDNKRHRYVVRGISAHNKKVSNVIDGWQALYRKFRDVGFFHEEEEPLPTDSFTLRHSVTKKHVLVDYSSILN